MIEILARPLSAKEAAIVRQLPTIPCDRLHLGALLNLVVHDGKLTRLGDVRHSSGRTWRDLIVAELDRGQPARRTPNNPFGYNANEDDDDDD